MCTRLIFATGVTVISLSSMIKVTSTGHQVADICMTLMTLLLLTPSHSHMHTLTALVLSSWLLDLDEGSLTLSASGVSGSDHSALDCTKFTLVSQR